MADTALARAEANFAAAKEACRTGHADADGATCTYGGMSAEHGYWLAAEDCERNHGDACDLRALCDGAPTETGFIGSEPDPEILYWVWRVCACQPCANLYAAAHSEWKIPDPDAPKPSYDEVMATLREQVEADRAAITPAEREASEMMTNLLLYGQHPAPALGYILPPGDSPEGEALWNAMVNGLPPKPLPPGSSTHTGLFDALGGVTPGTLPDPTETVMNAIVEGELRAGRTVARSQWAPRDCTCPWPWPMDGKHILTGCPHYVAPVRPLRGRNTRIGCQRYESGSWVHGDPHDCPRWVRG